MASHALFGRQLEHSRQRLHGWNQLLKQPRQQTGVVQNCCCMLLVGRVIQQPAAESGHPAQGS